MANREHVDILRNGPSAITEWRTSHPNSILELAGGDLKDLDLTFEEEIDLGAVDLRSAYIAGLRIQLAKLIRADFSGAIIEDSLFEGCDVSHASFYGSIMTRVNFTLCQMVDVNMARSELRFVDVSCSALGGSSISHAKIALSSFGAAVLDDVSFRDTLVILSSLYAVDVMHADFHGATLVLCDGLDQVDVSSAYVIGPQTESNIDWSLWAKLDPVFRNLRSWSIELRGFGRRGSPRNQLAHTLVTEQAPLSCFITFTESDDAFSKRLYDDLRSRGVRCWRWKEDAAWGQPLMREIDDAIGEYDKLIVICSEQSLQSPAVIRELERALQKEEMRQRERLLPDVLVPIRIDDYVFSSWRHHRKPDVISKVVGDFTKWQDPAFYDIAIERLLQNLKKDRTQPSDSPPNSR